MVLIREEWGYRYGVTKVTLAEVEAAAATASTVTSIPGAVEIDAERYYDLILFFNPPVVGIGEEIYED